MQHWSFVSIFEEYRRFSHPKSRSMDQQFIELFDTSLVQVNTNHLPRWAEIENDQFRGIEEGYWNCIPSSKAGVNDSNLGDDE